MNKAEERKRQSRDLRVRADNLSAKLDIAKFEAQEREREYRAALKKKDGVISLLQKEVAELSKENKELKDDLKSVRFALEKAQDTADTLRAALKKDSSTSSKPPSSDGYKKPRVLSTRGESGRRPGGQAGHAGHTLMPYMEPTAIVERMPVAECECGGAVLVAGGYTPKQRIELKIVVDITEERAYEGRCERCGKIHRGEFSKAFANPVQYGPGVKAVACTLNAYCNTTVGKTAEFIKSVTNGRIALSDGTVVNAMHGLAGRLDGTVEAIRQGLLAGRVMNIDETGMRTGGKLVWAQVFSNDKFSLFLRNITRGGMSDAGDSLLAIFTGILVHDHFKPYYRLSHVTHAECNVHILRALKAVLEILKHEWAKALTDFLNETNQMKKERIAAGDSQIDEDEAAEIKKRYLEILGQGDAEYDKATFGKKNITYYNDERLLLGRLRDYMDEHLRFILDFDAPFGNNGAEQGAKFLKSKIRCAGCFRSDKGSDDYLRAASLIATLRKQELGVFETIKNLFEGVEPAFVTSGGG